MSTGDIKLLTQLEICTNKISQYDKPIISVTGSCGKTTTCKMIHELLQNKYTIHKTHENCNSLKGIPWCVNSFFSLNSEFWLIEMGIDHIDEMEKLVELVKPKIRIVTNIGEAHLANFKDVTEYQNEKLKFFAHMDVNNVVIINNDDILLSTFKFSPGIKIIYCGSKDTDDIQLMDFKLNDDNISSTITIRINNINIKFRLNGICKHNALNCCLAIACANYLNIPINAILHTFNKFKLYKNRGLITVKPKYTLYDYTYNCIPNACLKNLENFKNITAHNGSTLNKCKLIIIGLSCLSPNFISYDYSIYPILNYSKTITNNIILYPVDNILMNMDEYKHINYCNTFDDIIQYIKLMTANNNNLSIFIQAEHYLQLYNLIDIINKIKI